MKINILKNIIIFILCISFFAFAKIQYVSIEEIREMAEKEGIQTVRQYNERREKNPIFNGKRLPSTPSEFYENWPSWGNVLVRRHMTLEDIREMAEEEGIQTSRQYKERRKKNDTFKGKRLPAHPDTFYPNWPGWGEALGHKIEYVSLEEIKEMAEEEGIRGVRQYQERRKKNDTFKGKRLPANPSEFYKNWPSWGNVLPRKYMNLEELKEFLIEKNIQKSKQYVEARKKYHTYNGKRLPTNPSVFYENWPSWGEALGNKIEYVSLEEIREMAEEEGIQTGVQYHERRRKNPNFNGKRLPANPYVFYKNWPGWGEALGKGKCEKVFNSSVRAS